MKTKQSILVILVFVTGLILFGCRRGKATPTPLPTYSLEQTSMNDFVIQDFDTVHAPVNGSTNEYLIFGNVPVSQPAAGLAPELAAFLGRWEGYSYGPPVKKDWKFVAVFQEITAQGGKALFWAGTNLQYPNWVKEVKFRVVPGDPPSIEFQYDLDGINTIKATIDPAQGLLRGWQITNNSPWGPIDMYRGESFYVYKDYGEYLASKRIYPKEYRNSALQPFGQGYLLYLPEGYEAGPEQTWPLIFFLHGSGDRGDNLFLLAKASPFMMIREKGPLPFIIVAPLLNTSKDYASFPDDYMDGVLQEVQADYRVDPKRIYVTGLSMGGEATYRFALNHPDTFAAIAPLAAFDPKYNLASGIKPFALPMQRIKNVPVWAIHGADDKVVSLAAAQSTVDDLKNAGGNVQFTVLEGHDHDVWTDTYTDPQFYEWLLQHQRP
jgi:predicted esterase